MLKEEKIKDVDENSVKSRLLFGCFFDKIDGLLFTKTHSNHTHKNTLYKKQKGNKRPA